MTHASSIELSVVAPCFNEAGNIAELVRRTMAVYDEHTIAGELIMVDDGSADDTWLRISEEMERDPRARGVCHAKNKGIEGAWHSGLDHARGKIMCLIDADLQNRPEDIPRLLEVYKRDKPDIVQAVRHPKNVHSRASFSKGFNHLLNMTFGTKLRDNKSGFIICHIDVLRTLLEHRFTYRYFQAFIGASAAVRNYSIAEVDTDFVPRFAGTSFLSDFPIAVSLRIVVELAMYRYETLGIEKQR